MDRLAARAVAVASLAMLTAFTNEVETRAAQAAVERLPPGWVHRRAVRAYERRQTALRDSIARIARAQVGVPYVFGGTTPQAGFDCSGLVRWVLAQVEMRPPRTARQQARIGHPVDTTRLRPGDLVTFGPRGSETHVGIYVGDGQFVHASSVARRVIVSRLDRPRYARVEPFAGARSVLVTAGLSSIRM